MQSSSVTSLYSRWSVFTPAALSLICVLPKLSTIQSGSCTARRHDQTAVIDMNVMLVWCRYTVLRPRFSTQVLGEDARLVGYRSSAVLPNNSPVRIAEGQVQRTRALAQASASLEACKQLHEVCPALLCSALPCPALPCPALPCPSLPCPALPCFPPFSLHLSGQLLGLDKPAHPYQCSSSHSAGAFVGAGPDTAHPEMRPLLKYSTWAIQHSVQLD